ncbi:FAD-dependent monooxygenase [Nocardia alni]|uniref:FAD-dependent monooxygenase n=1 Tax=Nocardia alni TaxID=2815723 RepID=UPI001C23C68D|nr:FAD-dependent monooxygenase [Nocardia alni]
MTSVRVVVVGAGIGGLTAAVALRSVGAQVEVFEQAAELGEVGAGVALIPSSLRVLGRLGLEPELSRLAAPVDKLWVRGPEGTILRQQDMGPRGTAGMYRPDLVEILAAALPDGVVHSGHRCTGFGQDEHSAHVSFDNGAHASADLVVAADGIHSVLQRHVVQPQPPVFSGRIAYRGVLPAAKIPGWPRYDGCMWNSPGKNFLTFPVHAGELRNFVGFLPADTAMRESWSAPGTPAALAAEFADWDPKLSELLAQIETTFRWGLYDHDPLPRWSRGRLTLLGDAAHAMLPHMGQGANQAIEDAIALATLTRDIPAAGIPEALTRYEQLRRPRTTLIQQGSRTNGQRLDTGERLDTPPPILTDYDIQAEAEALR